MDVHGWADFGQRNTHDQWPKNGGFQRFSCRVRRGTPLAAAHADMRSAAERLRLWSRALVVALAATTIAAAPLPAPAAAAGERRLIPLERMDEVSVMVDDMTPDAEALALTREIIQADAESQLLRNGLRVHSSGSMPALYFQISVLCDEPRPVRHRRLVGGGAGRLPRGDGDLVDPRQDLVHGADPPGAAVGGERERAQRRPRPGRRVRRRRPGSAARPSARGDAVGGAVVASRQRAAPQQR